MPAPNLTSGTITAQNGYVAVGAAGYDSVAIQVLGTYTGDLTVQFTLDGTNWFTADSAALLNITLGQATSLIPSGQTGLWRIPASTVSAVRVVALGAFTGTANIILNAAAGSNSVILSGPASVGRLISSAASTNATLVKAGSVRLFKILLHSNRGSDCYLKIYDKATTPVVGTDTPIATITIPNAGGQIPTFDFGSSPATFVNGLGYAITSGSADSDTGAIAANDITGLNIFYT